MRSFGTKRVYCNELGRRPEEDRDSRRLGGGGRVYLLHECARWSGGGDQKKSGATFREVDHHRGGHPPGAFYRAATAHQASGSTASAAPAPSNADHLEVLRVFDTQGGWPEARVLSGW